MQPRKAVLRKIRENALLPALIDESSHLYTDLGFDSLLFVSLLTEIESEHSISFGIEEMEDCLRVGNLIAKVVAKIRERAEGITP